MIDKSIKTITKKELRQYTKLGYITKGGLYFGNESAFTVLKTCMEQLKSVSTKMDDVEFHSDFLVRDGKRCYFTGKEKKIYLCDSVLFIGTITEYKEENKILFSGVFYRVK